MLLVLGVGGAGGGTEVQGASCVNGASNELRGISTPLPFPWQFHWLKNDVGPTDDRPLLLFSLGRFLLLLLLKLLVATLLSSEDEADDDAEDVTRDDGDAIEHVGRFVDVLSSCWK